MSLGTRAGATGAGLGHAVVIGSGLAGLTAARALATFMDRVTVIERDRLPRGPGRRRGLPQARHSHSLTAAAHQGLERLFPGIGEDFAKAGAVGVRMPQDMLILGPGGWLPRAGAGPVAWSASRDLIDAVVRDRLRADPGVTFLQEHEVVCLEPGRHDTVVGVWARRRDRRVPGGWDARRLIPADFVVDAAGRGSPTPRWLAELGYKQPRESVVAARAFCVSTVFAPPVGHVADWKSLLLMDPGGGPRQGLLHPVEGGRWSVTLRFGEGVRPPSDHEGLLRAAGALPHPLLREVIEAATPLGPVYGHAGRSGSRWRHYERLRRWPDQFLVVGDALAALDPSHGQGMTLAVDCALVLEHLLAGHGTAVGLSYRLRRALAHRLAPAWRAGTRGAGPETPAGPRGRLGRRYAARVAAAAATDPYAAALVRERLQMLAPPAAGLRPRVLRAALRGPRGPVPAEPPSSTHGPGARRRRPAAAAVPVIGVSIGSARPRPTGSSARWTATAPAGDRRRP